MTTTSQQLQRNKKRLGMMVFALITKQYRGHESKKTLKARMEFVRKQISIGEALVNHKP
jgi:hypothetical protein